MEGPGAGPAETAPPGSVEAAAATAAAFTTAAAAAAVAATEGVDEVEVEEESDTVGEEGMGSTACPAFLRILKRRRVKKHCPENKANYRILMKWRMRSLPVDRADGGDTVRVRHPLGEELVANLPREHGRVLRFYPENPLHNGWRRNLLLMIEIPSIFHTVFLSKSMQLQIIEAFEFDPI